MSLYPEQLCFTMHIVWSWSMFAYFGSHSSSAKLAPNVAKTIIIMLSHAILLIQEVWNPRNNPVSSISNNGALKWHILLLENRAPQMSFYIRDNTREYNKSNDCCREPHFNTPHNIMKMITAIHIMCYCIMRACLRTITHILFCLSCYD